jgi:hypothetical protein
LSAEYGATTLGKLLPTDSSDALWLALREQVAAKARQRLEAEGMAGNCNGASHHSISSALVAEWRSYIYQASSAGPTFAAQVDYPRQLIEHDKYIIRLAKN